VNSPPLAQFSILTSLSHENVPPAQVEEIIGEERGKRPEFRCGAGGSGDRSGGGGGFGGPGVGGGSSVMGCMTGSGHRGGLVEILVLMLASRPDGVRRRDGRGVDVRCSGLVVVLRERLVRGRAVVAGFSSCWAEVSPMEGV